MNVRQNTTFLSALGKREKRILNRSALKREALKPERNVKRKRGTRTVLFAFFSEKKRESKGMKNEEIRLKCIPERAKTWLTPFSRV